MSITRIYPVLERPIEGFAPGSGLALARVVEAHDVLAEMLDFSCPDPAQMAVAVGMVYPLEEDGADDLAELDFGPAEWFEAAAGLAAVRRALDAVRAHPESLAAAIYDPGLRSADVIADLETIERALLLARLQETRFHFRLESAKAPGPTI